MSNMTYYVRICPFGLFSKRWILSFESVHPFTTLAFFQGGVWHI